jgi:hypothetical protein
MRGDLRKRDAELDLVLQYLSKQRRGSGTCEVPSFVENGEVKPLIDVEEPEFIRLFRKKRPEPQG